MRKNEKTAAPSKLRTMALVCAIALGGASSAWASGTDSPVSGRIGSAALVERGLQAFADGRPDQADDDLSAALQADPRDATAAEGLAALRTARGDAEGAVAPALTLVRHGSPRQAVAAAEFLESAGRDALADMRSRPSAMSDVVSAEWIASRLVRAGRWMETKTVARSASKSFPSSWSLLISLATAEAMTDLPEPATETLLQAKAAGAPDEAVRAADGVIRAARTRVSVKARDDAKKPEEKKTETVSAAPAPERKARAPVAEPRAIETPARATPVAAPSIEIRAELPSRPSYDTPAARAERGTDFDLDKAKRTLAEVDALLAEHDRRKAPEKSRAPKGDGRFGPGSDAPKGDKLF
jgi:hypothetical protein